MTSAALVAVLALGCSVASREGRAHLVERVGFAMGSELRLTAWTSDEAADAAFQQAFQEFERLESLMSVWREGSDVARINAGAGEHPVAAAPEVREILRLASQVSDWTGGKFDVTFGALADVWKFDHDQDNAVPDPDAVRRRLPLIDYRGVVVDDGTGTVFLKRKGMRIHLGGIGKGYAIDRVVKSLRGRGLASFMVQAGGDLYVAGRRGDRPWRLGINDPRGPGGRSFATVELSEGTFSTSGDYERFFFKDGRRYHHLLDPATGQPAAGCRSVTIVAPQAVVADGLSTGVFIMGPQRGMELIERLPDVEGVIVTSKNEVLVSSGLTHRLVMASQPTDAP